MSTTQNSDTKPRQFLINIDVPDLEAATRFYTEAFDFTVGRRLGDGFTELLGYASPVYLLEKEPGTPPFKDAKTKRTFERHWCPVHFDFVVDDIEEGLAKAQRAGAKIESEIMTARYGRIAYGSDPFGNGFCMIQFTGRGYDEIVD